MRGRLQFCRRSQAMRNRLDPWSLPLALSLAQRRALTPSVFCAPHRNTPLDKVSRARRILVVLAIGWDPPPAAEAPPPGDRDLREREGGHSLPQGTLIKPPPY